MANDSELTARDNNREYRNDHIVVTWEPALCIHAAICVQSLPAVFNARARPWVNLSAGDPDAIARVVAECPSGAIKYRLLDGE
jgi:uncharacterized Fe-S cluster protein YjdI